MAGNGRHQTDDKTRDRIMKLHEDGLNYATIARRIGVTARTVSRIVKREQEQKTPAQ
jgi:IS30 family transposase